MRARKRSDRLNPWLWRFAAAWAVSGLWSSAADAQHHEPVPVPPTLELEVLDPGVDPLGNPAVVTTVGPDRQVHVDIPPSVIVHRYYYTGDRSFQAQLLPGGPTVLVFNNPGTARREYIEVTLPPGAPQVTYNRHFIKYDYITQAVIVTYGLHGVPKVTYRQGKRVVDTAREVSEQAARDTGRWLKRTGAPDYAHQVGRAARNATITVADRTHDISRAIISPVASIVKATPLGKVFTGDPERRAMEQRDTLLRKAQVEAGAPEITLPTVR